MAWPRLDGDLRHARADDGVRWGCTTLWALPKRNVARADSLGRRDRPHAVADVIATSSRKPGIWLAIVFIILFRAGEGQIQTIGPLFLREARAPAGWA
jgi:PAT family beta-lactamase induction signal transducer AmpG